MCTAHDCDSSQTIWKDGGSAGKGTSGHFSEAVSPTPVRRTTA